MTSSAHHPAKSDIKPSIRVLRCRLKDKHAAMLGKLAREVNMVWNYCNELSFRVWDRERRFMSSYELQKYTNGATKTGLSLHSQTVQAITDEYAKSRKQHKKVRLAWRKSGGTRRSLGWIPFKASALGYRNGQVHLAGVPLGLWDSYDLAKVDLGPGSISEDSRGRWYFNMTVKIVPKMVVKPAADDLSRSLGIDLGLKDFAAFSDKALEPIEAPKFYRGDELRLGAAQRAGKTRQVKTIHARISNRRKDFLHKLSTNAVSGCGALFVGNVNASALAKTRQSKSVLDAGWSTFRTMLKYKCADAGVWFEEVNEAYSTVTCSTCCARSGPKGVAGLRIREWTCGECGSSHHRDVNAAQNILRRGHATLAEGIPALSA
jgi:putative transposase